jgi:hypothetical protein
MKENAVFVITVNGAGDVGLELIITVVAILWPKMSGACINRWGGRNDGIEFLG